MTNHLPMIASALIVAAGLVSGCAEVRDAAGLAKKSPDEFQVMARPPLSLPPNFTLTPPTSAGAATSAKRTKPAPADQHPQAKAKILGFVYEKRAPGLDRRPTAIRVDKTRAGRSRSNPAKAGGSWSTTPL